MAIPMVDVNLVAVLVASIVGMIVGFVWYGPLFGKTWAKLMKIDMSKGKKKGMAKNMVAMFIAVIVTNYVLAHILAFTGASTVSDALMVGFWTWLGFYATTLLGTVLWEGKPVKLYLINVIHYLVILLISSAIIVSM